MLAQNKTILRYMPRWGERYNTIVLLLINAGADVNAQSPQVGTPLMFAVAKGYIELVEDLIRAGADVSIPDKKGRTPLVVAEAFGRFHIAETLQRAIRKQQREAFFSRYPELNTPEIQDALHSISVKVMSEMGVSRWSDEVADEVAKEAKKRFSLE